MSASLLIVICAVFWAMHVLLLGYLARITGLPVPVGCQLLLCRAAGAGGWRRWSNTRPSPALRQGWVQLLYAGVLATAVAFTMQAIGQQYVPAANAAIILSAESLFAALGGALFLGERLPPIGYAGAALIFIAIILVETVPALLQRRATAATPSKSPLA